MDDPMLANAHIVADAATARVFADSSKRRLLLGFVDQPLSVSEAARGAGQPLGKVHYHVIDLCRRGLLRVVSEQKRKGRAIKYYQAVRPSFFVPIEFVERSPGAGLAAELRARLDEEALGVWPLVAGAGCGTRTRTPSRAEVFETSM
ncbi:MAG: helix-turn-helix domain-containing protein, partial [Pseudomonadota bacterium]|nr:helix-turn-helix domain-containing protein [Pseudomonadota bacterium]